MDTKIDCNDPCNTAEKPECIVVLGIGNVLWADEGFGVRCVEALQQRYSFAPEIELVDGGTQGLMLVGQVQMADKLLILDAVDYGLDAGTLHIVENEEVPKFMGAKKMSLHQTGFQEVLQLAQLMGRYPAEVVLIGCQPEYLEDYGGSLRPIVKLALEQAVLQSVERLQNWGVSVTPRTQSLNAQDAIVVPTLSMHAYEAGRPDAATACRVGDERFLAPSNLVGA